MKKRYKIYKLKLNRGFIIVKFIKKVTKIKYYKKLSYINKE